MIEICVRILTDGVLTVALRQKITRETREADLTEGLITVHPKFATAEFVAAVAGALVAIIALLTIDFEAVVATGVALARRPAACSRFIGIGWPLVALLTRIDNAVAAEWSAGDGNIRTSCVDAGAGDTLDIGVADRAGPAETESALTRTARSALQISTTRETQSIAADETDAAFAVVVTSSAFAVDAYFARITLRRAGTASSTSSRDAVLTGRTIRGRQTELTTFGGIPAFVSSRTDNLQTFVIPAREMDGL